MKRLWVLLLLSSALSANEPAEQQSENSDSVQTLAANNGYFGWDLYQQVRAESENICFSPYSITSALMIPYIGAKGETKTQMAKGLKLEMSSPELEMAFGQLNAQLTQHPTNYPQSFRVLIANSLWVQERMRLQGQFLADVRKNFRSVVQRVDFINRTELARDRINRWVAHHTHNRVTDLIQRGILDHTTRMVVVSALFLKAKWLMPFSSRNTHLLPFFPNSRKTLNVSMMQQTDRFPFLEEKEALVLELPLERPSPDGPELVLDLVLPKRIDGIEVLENRLSATVLNSWFDKLQNERVTAIIPKFTVRQSLGLVESLMKMGLTLPFSSEADF